MNAMGMLMLGRLTRIETVCLAAAAALLALAVGFRFYTAGSGGEVNISPANRTEYVWETGPVPDEPAQRADGENININSADAETLRLLPGIGEVLSERMIEYREENGPFGDISEIMEVEGIGQTTFDKIKDYITAEDVP
ncbi:MAG: helix-hairpin-helix domain-containing protein [Clostridia bacterium]|nr:helix-hairpin-helix domain-containing protein [Clostridia bacterium]NCC69044.1 helix-hairpin-helix domain-containing protein [Clostridia bacterium]